jgi:hypothetical protein
MNDNDALAERLARKNFKRSDPNRKLGSERIPAVRGL